MACFLGGEKKSGARARCKPTTTTLSLSLLLARSLSLFRFLSRRPPSPRQKEQNPPLERRFVPQRLSHLRVRLLARTKILVHSRLLVVSDRPVDAQADDLEGAVGEQCALELVAHQHQRINTALVLDEPLVLELLVGAVLFVVRGFKRRGKQAWRF
jgi:hypothetical protein